MRRHARHRQRVAPSVIADTLADISPLKTARALIACNFALAWVILALMPTSPADAALILESLEIAARAGDLTPAVYGRLFAEQPLMAALFWRDTNNAIKGEMLARVFAAIIDFVGERRYADKLIQCEVVTHDGYDVPPAVFATFFAVVAGELKLVCGADWTPAMQAAWDRLLGELDFYVHNPSHVVASS